MAQQELKELRRKLESQEKEFQNYRDECKMLENFLEEESQKKQLEIRQLKEEAINREKTVKLLKSENSQLQAQLSNIKAELQNKKKDFDPDYIIKLKAIQEQLNSKAKELRQLNERFVIVQTQLQQSLSGQKLLKGQIDSIRQKKQNLEKQLQKLQREEERKNTDFQKIKILYEEQKEKLIKMKEKGSEITPKKLTKQTSVRQLHIDRERVKNDEKIRKYEAKIERMEKIIKQLKIKLAESNQNVIPEKTKEQTEKDNSNQVKIYTSCYIVTKPYYMSPYLEVNQQTKIVKLLKSSRMGCYEKSLGATKHKFQCISYNQQTVLNSISAKIQEFQQDYPHFVLIYGPKKTSKRALLSSLIQKLLFFLKEKIEEYTENDLSALYIKKNSDEDNPIQRVEVFTKEDILSLLQKLSKPIESPKKSEKNIGKKIEKALITYFCLRINDFCLEIATSSLTNIPLRDKDLISTFYNNVLYSKLPDVLQSSFGQKYLILTLNPIVDLYQDCKNTLSVTQHKMLYLDNKNQDNREVESPNKELLNTMARKKLEQYEKEIQQNGLKIRRVEDECFYYKMKFDQLGERLKNLISTHHNQNSYLKKSPILLSYEKMLKFVHSVQAKSMQTFENSLSGLQFDELDLEDDEPDVL